MATAGELIREAQFAVQNVSPGSADEKKYIARAQKYAKRVLRKYPRSIEAVQAREMLGHLGVVTKPPPASRKPLPSKTPLSPSPHKSHSPDAPHKHLSSNTKKTDAVTAARTYATDDSFTNKAVTAARSFAQSNASDEISWAQLWETFRGLSYFNKKAVGFIGFVIFLVVVANPYLLIGLAIYLAQPAVFLRHLHRALSALT